MAAWLSVLYESAAYGTVSTDDDEPSLDVPSVVAPFDGRARISILDIQLCRIA